MEREKLTHIFSSPLGRAKATASRAAKRLGIEPVILDWTQADYILDGVRTVLCDSRALARRVHATTRRMSWPPRLTYILERSLRHAA